MAKTLLIPVISKRKHDRNRYPGTIYGLEREFVVPYVKRGLVKLNLAVLDSETASQELKDLVEEYRDLLSAETSTDIATSGAPVGGREDARLKELNELPYNRGAESIYGYAKAIADHLGIEVPGKGRPALTDFILNNYDVLKGLKE